MTFLTHTTITFEGPDDLNVQSTGNSTSPLCVYIVDFSLTLSPGL